MVKSRTTDDFRIVTDKERYFEKEAMLVKNKSMKIESVVKWSQLI